MTPPQPPTTTTPQSPPTTTPHQPASTSTPTSASTSTQEPSASPATPQSQSPETKSETEAASTKQTDEARTAFIASLHSLSAPHTTELVERAKILHANEAALRAQEDQLVRTTGDLAKMNGAWEGVAEEARRGLKEIGDVQNWAEVIERELLVVEESLRLAEQKEGVGEGEEERGDSTEEEEGGGRGVNGKVDDGGVDVEGGNDDLGKGKGTEKKGWFGWW